MWQQQEGKGDGATFENDIAIYGIYLNLGDSDEGEFEVISTIQGSGKEDSTIERNKESRKGHWTIETMILQLSPCRTSEQRWSVGTWAQMR